MRFLTLALLYLRSVTQRDQVEARVLAICPSLRADESDWTQTGGSMDGFK